jgi:hypothetical protein
MSENFPKRIIICASGNSIPFDDKTGLDKKLVDLLKTEYSIGLNLWYKYACETTIVTWADWQFYKENVEAFKKLPLLVGKYDPSLVRLKLLQPNTIVLPYCNKYWGKESWSPDFIVGKNIWKRGFYCPHLVGFFALTMAIALGFENIYILGFDCKAINGKTHFYQDIVDLTEKRKCENTLVHYGVGRKKIINKQKNTSKMVYNTGTYNDDVKKFDNRWEPYKKELNNIKIINVSPESRIKVFPKISYSEFYKILEEQPEQVLQSIAREQIRDMIEERLYHEQN